MAIAVSGQSSFARFIKLPPVEPKRIPEIVKFEAVQQVPFPLGEVEWAYQLFKQTDSPDVEVGIFAIRKDLVNHQIQLFSGLGGNIELVQMSTLAIQNAMTFDERVTETTMFMDMGAENTDLIITDGSTVWLRTLQIGGNSFTDTLAKMFKLTFAKAEELKRNATTSKYAKQIFMAMRPVFADLVVEIQRSMNFYSTVHRESRIGRIVALGSTFQLPGLQKYLQQNLQMPVDKLDGFAADKPEDAKTAAAFVEHASTLATAYGLAVQVLGGGMIKTSLLPEHIQRAKMWKDKTKWFTTAAATMVLASMSAGGYLFFKQSQWEQKSVVRNESLSVITKAQSSIDSWKNNVQNKGKTDATVLEQIDLIQGYRDSWLRIVETLFSSMPDVDVQKLKDIPRDKREVLMVDYLVPRYLPNSTETEKLDIDSLSSIVMQMETETLNKKGRSAWDRYDKSIGIQKKRPGAVEEKDDGKNRAYLILLSMHTSSKDIGFLEEKFVKNLLAYNQAANAGKENWYVSRVEMIDKGLRFIPKTADFTGPVSLLETSGKFNIPPNDRDLVELTSPTSIDMSGSGVVGAAMSYVPPVTSGTRINRPLTQTPNLSATGEEEEPCDDLDFPGENFKQDTRIRYLVLVKFDPEPQETPAEPEKPAEEVKPADGETPVDVDKPADGDAPKDGDKPDSDKPAVDAVPAAAKEDNN